jgi:hypothetical protein
MICGSLSDRTSGVMIRVRRKPDGGTDEVDAAWRAKSVRRLAKVRAGSVELVDADDHYARLRASLTE